MTYFTPRAHTGNCVNYKTQLKCMVAVDLRYHETQKKGVDESGGWGGGVDWEGLN